MSVALSSQFCIELLNWLNLNAPAASALHTYQHSDMHAKYQRHNWWLYQKALASVPHNFITQYNACQHLKAFCAHFNLQSPTEWTKCLSHPRTAWENDLLLPCNLRFVLCACVCVCLPLACVWETERKIGRRRLLLFLLLKSNYVALCNLLVPQDAHIKPHTHTQQVIQSEHKVRRCLKSFVGLI